MFLFFEILVTRTGPLRKREIECSEFGGFDPFSGGAGQFR